MEQKTIQVEKQVDNQENCNEIPIRINKTLVFDNNNTRARLLMDESDSKKSIDEKIYDLKISYLTTIDELNELKEILKNNIDLKIPIEESKRSLSPRLDHVAKRKLFSPCVQRSTLISPREFNTSISGKMFDTSLIMNIIKEKQKDINVLSNNINDRVPMNEFILFESSFKAMQSTILTKCDINQFKDFKDNIETFVETCKAKFIDFKEFKDLQRQLSSQLRRNLTKEHENISNNEKSINKVSDMFCNIKATVDDMLIEINRRTTNTDYKILKQIVNQYYSNIL